MRILMVLGTSAGGVGRHVASLVGGLVADGHEVLVACPAAVRDEFGLDRLGARTMELAVSDRPSPDKDARTMALLRRASLRADVVHAHGVRAGALCALALTSLPGRSLGQDRAPLVVTLHNAAPPARVTGAVHAVLERIVASRAALVLGVSSDIVERVHALGAPRARLAVVPAPPLAPAATSREETRAQLDAPEHTRIALVVGRLAPQKGLDTLLDAAALLARCRVPVQVLVAGDGPLREQLQFDIDERSLPVRLLGRRSDIAELLAAADLVVSSAIWEGQPVALQEALQAGRAIVATDAGGTADVLQGAGELVPVGDAATLARAIRLVVNEPGRLAALEAAARRRAASLPRERDAVADALAAYREARPPASGFMT